MNKEYSWTENQTDDIWYHGKFDSIEACIKDAISCGKKPGEKIVIGICEAYVPHLNADTLLDQVGEDAYEEVGEAAEGYQSLRTGKAIKMLTSCRKKLIRHSMNGWRKQIRCQASTEYCRWQIL